MRTQLRQKFDLTEIQFEDRSVDNASRWGMLRWDTSALNFRLFSSQALGLR
jgi:hypothetical protein